MMIIIITYVSVQVIVLQEYHNDSSSALEAKYVFPLDEMSVVCGFEAFINGKHVVGVVKQKETAHREYRQAVEAGHGAYLMDQEKEQPVCPPHLIYVVALLCALRMYLWPWSLPRGPGERPASMPIAHLT